MDNLFGQFVPISPKNNLHVKNNLHFSFRAILNNNGAAGVTRTPDLRITNAPLYQLSYSGPATSSYLLLNT